jgi:phosphatidylglycerophosphate synthase
MPPQAAKSKASAAREPKPADSANAKKSSPHPDADPDADADARFARILRGYRYVAPENSIFEQLAGHALWAWLAKFFPHWVAPNLITLAGGIAVLLQTLMLFRWSPDVDGSAPRWMYACAFPLLTMFYQTMDGIDGKHARRTGTGSPMGELFDHGVDAVVASLITLLGMDVMLAGAGTTVCLWNLIGVQINFGVSNLGLVHRGRQRFLMVDNQEAQICVSLGALLLGLGGPEVLTRPLAPALAGWRPLSGLAAALPLPGGRVAALGAACDAFDVGALSVRGLLLGYASFSMALNALTNVAYLVRFYVRGEQCFYGNESGQNAWTLAHQVACFGLHGAFAAVAGVLSKSFWAWLVVSSLGSATMTARLLVTRMTGADFPLVPPALVLTGAAAARAWFAATDAWRTDAWRTDAWFAATDAWWTDAWWTSEAAFAVAACAMWATYCVGTLLRFSEVLGINVLTLTDAQKRVAKDRIAAGRRKAS